jgi:hypothetical protein
MYGRTMLRPCLPGRSTQAFFYGCLASSFEKSELFLNTLYIFDFRSGSFRRRATTRLRLFRAEVTGRTHPIIELAKDILMQGQRINKGQSGAMA